MNGTSAAGNFIDFGDTLGPLGDHHELDDHQDQEHHSPDDDVAGDNYR